MIISHKYKFIFLKTTRTASTAIEVELSKAIEETAIVTPVHPPEDGHVPRNYETEQHSFRNHIPAQYIRSQIGSELFGSYYKFCVEREPVDKCISYYSMQKNSPFHRSDDAAQNFDDFVNLGRFPVDTAIYTEPDGALLVDRILKFEHIEEDFISLCDELGLNISLNARAKSGFREDIVPTDLQTQKIYRAFESSQPYTGYKLRES